VRNWHSVLENLFGFVNVENLDVVREGHGSPHIALKHIGGYASFRDLVHLDIVRKLGKVHFLLEH